MRNGSSCQRQRWSLPASACGSTKENANEKISSFAGLLEKCCKMNKTTYLYPNFLEFQIVCRGPHAAAGREFETPVEQFGASAFNTTVH